jgi:carbon-monoxide dehydrogenase iron sulfur subunit
MRKAVIYSPRPESLEGFCTGCRLCERMCSLEHLEVFNPTRSRIKVVSFEGGIEVPVTCNHCTQCLDSCPLNLIKSDSKSGTIIIDEEKCNGCQQCIEICPIGAITLDPHTKKALKCDLCGGNPICVEYCPAKVLTLTNRSDSEEVRKRRSEFAAVLASEKLFRRPSRSGAVAIKGLNKIVKETSK